MSEAQAKVSLDVGSEVMTALRSLQALLQKERTKVGSKGRVDVHFTETEVKGYEQGIGVIECKIVFTGRTSAEATEMAKDYDAGGWICTSSGETEVTCKTPDE